MRPFGVRPANVFASAAIVASRTFFCSSASIAAISFASAAFGAEGAPARPGAPGRGPPSSFTPRRRASRSVSMSRALISST